MSFYCPGPSSEARQKYRAAVRSFIDRHAPRPPTALQDELLAVDARWPDDPRQRWLGHSVEFGSMLERKLIDRELAVQSTAWFDYRFLSPLEKTFLFAETYQEVYRDTYGRNFDTREAAKKHGLFSGGLLKPREFVSVTIARQFADELGMPYPTFLSYAVRWFLEGRSHRIPRPNQLYSEKYRADLEEALRANWAELQEARMWYSTRAEYLTANFQDLPDQRAHRIWCLDQIRNARSQGAAAWGIERLCFEDHVLPFDMVKREIHPAIVERVKPPTELKSESRSSLLLPSCFGASSLLDCRSCGLADECQLTKENALRLIVERTGSDDPQLEHRRANGRERTRRFRAKKIATAH